MSINFAAPSYRAGGQDLAISISPLGLVELADEEFEIHGPRLNRYSLNWAFYLGHHWSHRRETGEPQSTFNYFAAFTNYLVRFTFAKGVNFTSPKTTEAIVPSILDRVWEVDNDKIRVLLEMGTTGAVSGDCFVKVAYEDAYQDSVGRVHPGRARILPLQAMHCFPEYHPHDRDRLIRFKLKYRFWGCLDMETEALTRRGWMLPTEIREDDEILQIDPVTGEMSWSPATVNIYDYSGEMVRWSFGAVSTPNHRWLADIHHRRGGTSGYDRQTLLTEFVHDAPRESRVILGGGAPTEFALTPKWSDELVETVAWYICDGSDHINQTGFHSVHLGGKKPHKVAAWRRLAHWWAAQGATFREGAQRSDGQSSFYLGKGVVEALQEVAPNKQVLPEFLHQLTYAQAKMFFDTLIAADGNVRKGKNHTRWAQVDEQRADMFQMLSAMLGKATGRRGKDITVYASDHAHVGSLRDSEERFDYDGQVWCPTVGTGFFMARRNGRSFWTGNTSPQGTRAVYTYTEILSEDSVEEYINDELIDSRPNPLGVIPIVHIPNIPVPGSPWGLSDCQDIIELNRQYNEIATDVADIINYHAAPVTIITGAKFSQLEKGAKKVWAGLPKEASVFNLEGGGQGLSGALEYMELLKRAMHEMVGIPETALGQIQPISNTSGVALSIQFQPLMNRYAQKIAQYGAGLQKINELVLLTLATKEPEVFVWDENTEVPLKPGQLPQLDPADPVTYETGVNFPPPLPLDALVVLNEIQSKMQMGLESREGALRTLGEEFPEEKLSEIRAEQMDDAKSDGALQLLKAQIQKQIMDLTGMSVTPDGAVMPMDPEMAMLGDGDVLGDGAVGPATGQLDPAKMAEMQSEAEVRNQLVTLAYGTKLAQRRNPDSQPTENP